MLAQLRGSVIALNKSPFASMCPLPLQAVRLNDRFWAPRLQTNRSVTLPSQIQQCEETGRIDNFRRASGKKQIDFQGIYFNDSDVYKLLEAIAYAIAYEPNASLEAQMEAIIAEIATAQQPDGYLNTYFMFDRAKDRFTNLRDMHEIYCAGHLFQAAVAHYRATGRTHLLDVARRYADLLYDKFGPNGQPGACGHPEAEMALVELARTTGEARYLELARCMVEARGRGVLGGSSYHQDHVPFVEQREFVGHAVRHLYLASGATDIELETGDKAYLATLDALWQDLIQHKLYITGGAGSRYEGEAFGAPYELPDDRAYAETCANIALVMWCYRLLHLKADPIYADIMERALYNGVLSGISLDGEHYFYQNPLADRGGHRRQKWFGCACCPPNIARLLASLPGYFASANPSNQLYLHLYAQSEIRFSASEGDVSLRVNTNYPWEGLIEIEVLDAPSHTTTLFLRIPQWAANATLRCNGNASADTAHPASGSYAKVALSGAPATIRLELSMPIQWIQSHPHVQNHYQKVALVRGPIVYCLEQADHSNTDPWDILLTHETTCQPEERPELLNGVTVLTGRGVALKRERWAGKLYAPYQPYEISHPVTITAIPYYAWANREAGPMTVWLPVL